MRHRTDLDHERQLIKKALNDPEAFRALYELYIERVYAYVAARVDDHKDAEDIVSDVFLSLVQCFGQFHHQRDASFAAWVFTIARNAVYDYYRREHRHPAAAPLDALQQEYTSDVPLDMLIAQQETAREVRRLISGLPERRREIITLRFFGGLRNREIAVVLGLDERTIASHLSRGLKDLYQRFRESEIQTERFSYDS